MISFSANIRCLAAQNWTATWHPQGTKKPDLLRCRFLMNSRHVAADRNVLIQEAKYFGIKQQSKAEKIIATMLSKVSNWEKVFNEFKVPVMDIGVIGKEIEERMAKVKS